MRAAFAYQRFADRFSEWMGAISKYMVMITVLVGFMNVLLRYTGERIGIQLTNNGLLEAQWYLYSLIFLFGFGYILKHGVNVRVDFWFANQTKRRKAWIDFVGHLIALVPFCIIPDPDLMATERAIPRSKRTSPGPHQDDDPGRPCVAADPGDRRDREAGRNTPRCRRRSRRAGNRQAGPNRMRGGR